MGSLLSSGQFKDLFSRTTKRAFLNLLDLFILRNVCSEFDRMIKKKKYACKMYHKYTQEELEPFSKYLTFIWVPGPSVIESFNQYLTPSQLDWFPCHVDLWGAASVRNLELLKHAHNKGLIKNERRAFIRGCVSAIHAVKKGHVSELVWIVNAISNGKLPPVGVKIIAQGGLDMCKLFVNNGTLLDTYFSNSIIEQGDLDMIKWLMSKVNPGLISYFNPRSVSYFECAIFCIENKLGNLSLEEHFKSAVKSPIFDKEWIDWCLYNHIQQQKKRIQDTVLKKGLFVGRYETVKYVLEKVENMGKRYLIQKAIHRAFSINKPELWENLASKGYKFTPKCYESVLWKNMDANRFLFSHNVEIPNGLYKLTLERHMFQFKAVLEYFEWLKSKGILPTSSCTWNGLIDYEIAKFLVENGVFLDPRTVDFFCDVRIIEYCELTKEVWWNNRCSLFRTWCRKAIKNRDLVTFAWLFKKGGKPMLNECVWEALGTYKERPEFASWLEDNGYLDSTI